MAEPTIKKLTAEERQALEAAVRAAVARVTAGRLTQQRKLLNEELLESVHNFRAARIHHFSTSDKHDGSWDMLCVPALSKNGVAVWAWCRILDLSPPEIGGRCGGITTSVRGPSAFSRGFGDCTRLDCVSHIERVLSGRFVPARIGDDE